MTDNELDAAILAILRTLGRAAGVSELEWRASAHFQKTADTYDVQRACRRLVAGGTCRPDARYRLYAGSQS